MADVLVVVLLPLLVLLAAGAAYLVGWWLARPWETLTITTGGVPYRVGEWVTLTGVRGRPDANGRWRVTRVEQREFAVRRRRA